MTRLLSRIKAFLDRLDYLLAKGVDHQENVWRTAQMTHTTHSTPHPALDSGEPHTEAGAGDGVGASERAGRWIVENGKEFERFRQNFTTTLLIRGPNMTLPEMSARLCWMRDEITSLTAQLAAITAERDALVGAVIEQATWQVRSSVPGHMMVCDTERICDAVRALTTTDATAALDHIRAQAKAEGLREAADKFEREDHHWGAPIASALRALAAAVKEARDG